MGAWPAFPCSRARASRSSASTTMPSSSRRRRRSIPCATSRRRWERRSGIRCPGHGSPTSSPAAAAWRSSSSRAPSRCPALPPTRARRRSPPSSTSSSGSGCPPSRHTILIAGGLERRAGRRELEAVLRPTRARDFRGTVVVHDATSSDLRPLELQGRAARAHPRLAARGRPDRVRHRGRDLRARWAVRAPRCLRGRGDRLGGSGAVAPRAVALPHRRPRRQGRGGARDVARPSSASRSCSTIRA